jgi:hypothetical protein
MQPIRGDETKREITTVWFEREKNVSVFMTDLLMVA